MPIRTFKLRILRPFYSEDIEQEIKQAKSKVKKGKLNQSFWLNLKNKHNILIMQDLFNDYYGIIPTLRWTLTKAYNQAMSEIYNNCILKNKPLKYEQTRIYHIVYDQYIFNSNIALGLINKIKSNINRSKMKDMKNCIMSLPTATSQKFPIPIYRQTARDKEKGFEILPYKEGEFIIKIPLPNFKFQTKYYKNKEGKKCKYKQVIFVKEKAKNYVSLWMSTNRIKKIRGKIMFLPDQSTNKAILEMIEKDKKEPEKSIFQKRWENFAKKYYKDDWMMKKFGFENKTLEDRKELLRNKYKIGYLEIIQGKKYGEKSKWMLNFCVEIPPIDSRQLELDKNICGGMDINMAMHSVVSCAINNSDKRASIPGNELLAFNKKCLKTIKQIQKDSRWKRGGHGKKNKYKPLNERKILYQERRKKILERWVKDIANFLIKNHVGTFQMENLDSLSKDDDGFSKLQRCAWDKGTFQTMIASKLENYDIIVKKINPKYTSQICSNCGHWNKQWTFEYRSSHSMLKCDLCKLEIYNDYNASKNISNPQIETIIKKTVNKEKNECNCKKCLEKK